MSESNRIEVRRGLDGTLYYVYLNDRTEHCCLTLWGAKRVANRLRKRVAKNPPKLGGEIVYVA